MAHGATIFCDDIRDEVGQKRSLMGTYTDTFIVPAEFPTTISKLCALIIYVEGIEEEHSNVEVRIYLPNDEEGQPSVIAKIPMAELMSNISGTTAAGKRTKSLIVRTALAFEGIKVSGPSAIRVEALRNGETIDLGTLAIKEAPPAETSKGK